MTPKSEAVIAGYGTPNPMCSVSKGCLKDSAGIAKSAVSQAIPDTSLASCLTPDLGVRDTTETCYCSILELSQVVFLG